MIRWMPPAGNLRPNATRGRYFPALFSCEYQQEQVGYRSLHVYVCVCLLQLEIIISAIKLDDDDDGECTKCMGQFKMWHAYARRPA